METLLESEPLIFTIKGNLPQSALRYETEWINKHPDFMVFKERHLLLTTGEVVKESAHVYDFKGVELSPQPGTF